MTETGIKFACRLFCLVEVGIFSLLSVEKLNSITIFISPANGGRFNNRVSNTKHKKETSGKFLLVFYVNMAKLSLIAISSLNLPG
jgi:hypothetical protein